KDETERTDRPPPPESATPSFPELASGAGVGSSLSATPYMFGDQFINTKTTMVIPTRTISGPVMFSQSGKLSTGFFVPSTNAKTGLGIFTPVNSFVDAQVFQGAKFGAGTTFTSLNATQFGFNPPATVALQANATVTSAVQSQLAKSGETA